MQRLAQEHSQAPLVMHIIYRLAIGGLENGLVNVINHMPAERYRHAIVCLTDATDFRQRLQRPDVPIVELHKRAGQDVGLHLRLWRLFRHWRPAIVHSRNFVSLEYAIPAMCARVPGRIHGEHGRDMQDLDGSRRTYNLWRRLLRPCIHHYTTVSQDLARWLVARIGIAERHVTQIYNGVDAQRFHPRGASRPPLGPAEFATPATCVIGTVGRMQTVKDQLTLVRAFLQLVTDDARLRDQVRLVMIGDGPLRVEAQQLLRQANAESLAWLPGARDDIPELLRALDVFVLPSLAEGISNTILEAMASGLPVVATGVGGNLELVDDGQTGCLVPVADPSALAQALRGYVMDSTRVRAHGEAGRRKVEAQFSMEAMVQRYLAVYDAVLTRRA